MANILIAWELGGGYGHLDSMFSIGNQLTVSGHSVHYAVRDLPRAELRAGSTHLKVFQSPYYLAQSSQQASAINYSGILLRCGYNRPTELAGLIRGWIQLITLIQPEIILVDHAPGAIIAAKILNIPVCNTATGFVFPPVINPLPGFQDESIIPLQQLEKTDSLALLSINTVIKKYSAKPLDNLAQLFDIEHNFMCTFSELDHYGTRSDTDYCGSIYSTLGDSFPAWQQDSEKKKVFLYLSAAHPLFKSIVEQLRNSPYQVLLHPRDIKWKHNEQTIDQNLFISPRPVNMDTVTKHADIIICHGGHATSSAVLLSGIPLLIIPQQIEQQLFANRLASQNLAVHVNPCSKNINWIKIISQKLNDDALQSNVKKFSDKYNNYEVSQSCQHIVKGIEKVLAKK